MKLKIALAAAALFAASAISPASATTAAHPGNADGYKIGAVHSQPVTYRNGGIQLRLSIGNNPKYYRHRRHHKRYYYQQPRDTYYDSPYYNYYNYDRYYYGKNRYYRPHHRNRGCHFDPLFGGLTCNF